MHPKRGSCARGAGAGFSWVRELMAMDSVLFPVTAQRGGAGILNLAVVGVLVRTQEH